MEKKTQILITDDDQGSRDILEAILYNEGYELIFAKNGKEALNIVNKNSPDLILLDIMMPDMDGFEVCKKIREDSTFNNIPIILLTALDDRNSRMQGFEVGADDFISKPFDKIELRIRIRTISKLNRFHNLQQERQKYKRLIELSPDGIIVIDSNGIIRLTNKAILQTLGFKKDKSLLSKHIFSFIKPEQRIKYSSIIKEIIYNKKTYSHFETYLLNKQNKYIPVELNAGYFEHEGESTLQIIVRDITERIESKKELMKAKITADKANKHKDHFLANISHELRTPLNGIGGMTYLLSDTNLTKDQQDYLELLQVSYNDLLRIVNDIMDYSAITTQQFKINNNQFNIENLTKKTVEILNYHAEKKSLKLNHSIDNKFEHDLYGDSYRLQQILINLITNGIKYTEKGEININIKQTKNLKSKIWLQIVVSDTGEGIPENKLNTIFDHFMQLEAPYTKTHRGVGLGLSIVKNLVDLMGGNIKVISKIGQGSTFIITLPFKKVENNEEQNHTIHKILKQKKSKTTILIAEDNEINRLPIVIMLKKKGFLTDAAINGQEVLEKINKNNYDLILMDIGMPILDGIETTKIIRENEKDSEQHIPIIAVTGYNSDENREKCINAGIDDYLSKPFLMPDLFDKIEKHINIYNK